jgi:hypothetical protein
MIIHNTTVPPEFALPSDSWLSAENVAYWDRQADLRQSAPIGTRVYFGITNAGCSQLVLTLARRTKTMLICEGMGIGGSREGRAMIGTGRPVGLAHSGEPVRLEEPA